jgi:uncharacterized membrane protein YqjE
MMREGNGDPTLRDQPVAELVKQLAEQTKTLARQEVELAKAELAEKGKKAGVGAGMFGAAGLFGIFAFGVLTAFLVLVLATAMEAWLAALLVAMTYGTIAGVLALSGKKEFEEAVPPVPEQTVETVKEDIQWAKQSAQAGRQ